MARYLITQSLLSSWAYTFDCAEGCEDEARQDFIRTLNREPGETNANMQNGIDFENLCYSIANGTFRPECEYPGKTDPNSGELMEYCSYPPWYQGACKVAEIIKGAPVQVRASRELDTAGMKFLVYGVLDSLKAGTIYDVKFLNKSLGSVDVYGKYLSSAQHPAYFFIVPEAREFKYLLSDGSDLYIETYTREQTRHISEIVETFIESIRGMGLLELYMEKWLAR